MGSRRVSLGVLAALAALLVPAAGQAHAAAAPTDPLQAGQWPLASGALDAVTAWRASTGAGTLVAVLDTGTDLTHRDLAGALWTNPGEIPGNGIDDDHDGFVDDVHGADMLNGSGDPSDDDGHGTDVAGIIAAQRNGIGAVGLAPGARILSVKVLDSHESGTSTNVAEGIYYALARGARIINVSMNAALYDPVLEAAVRAAQADGAVIVAAAGNDGHDLDLTPSYPAAFSEDNVLAVAASGQNGLLAAFSDSGPLSVDLAAPGTSVVSTALGGGWEKRSGTSMAAAYVSATLALLSAARPDLSATQLAQTVRQTATHPAGLAALLSAGELDPVAALHAVVPASRWAPAAPRKHKKHPSRTRH